MKEKRMNNKKHLTLQKLKASEEAINRLIETQRNSMDLKQVGYYMDLLERVRQAIKLLEFYIQADEKIKEIKIEKEKQNNGTSK